MSINPFKNSAIRVADDLPLSTQTDKQQKGLLEKNSLKTVAIEKLTVVEVKESEALSKKESVTQEQLDEQEQTEQEIQLQSAIVSDAMKTISEFINMPVRTVNFTLDDGSEKTVIKIFDSESNELIKQFPSEEILSIAQRIIELQQDISQKTGILLDENI